MGFLPLTACGSGSVAATDGGNKKAPLYSELPAEIQQAGTISVGSSVDYPPFEYYAADGRTIKGFEFELAEELERLLGVSFTWHNAGFDTLFTALRSHRYDVVYGAVNDTKEREQLFDFVNYLSSSQVFVVAKGNPEDIRSSEDVCGNKIAAVRGGVQAQILEAMSKDCAKDGKGKIVVRTFEGNSGEQLAVRQGNAAALLENYPTAVTFAEKSEGALEVVPGLEASKGHFGMVVGKDNAQLRDALQKAWQAIMDDGSYGKVLKKWGVSDTGIKKAHINGAESSVTGS